MITEKIYESMDYKMFQLLSFNRKVEKTNNLRASMKKYGFLSAFPLFTVRKKGKLCIKAGHHRFTVARDLGIPVKYVVCNCDISIYELEIATNHWDMKDYAQSFASDSTDYETVKEYHAKTGIGLNNCISMLAGNTAKAGNHLKRFKQGVYKVKDTSHIDDVAAITKTMKDCGFKFATSSNLVGAISKILLSGEVNVNYLVKKIKAHPEQLIRQAGSKEYMTMIENIYNFRAKEKIPLVFIAEKAARSRNVVLQNMNP